jgi:hypothetical protein
MMASELLCRAAAEVIFSDLTDWTMVPINQQSGRIHGRVALPEEHPALIV